MLNISIRKLTPDLVEDYVHFFDTTPHDDNIDEHKCYCVCWCNDDSEGRDFSSAAKRREYAVQFVKGGNIQGYLAYQDDKVVGWCNANTRADCLKCESGRRYMGTLPVESPDVKVKSIFCFVIAPEMRRKGVSALLLERVCEDAARDGFDFVEAYPNKEFVNEQMDYMGHIELYRKNGFTVYHEYPELKNILRKELGRRK
jgi:GNAT superfamily N-acetyltransferase